MSLLKQMYPYLCLVNKGSFAQKVVPCDIGCMCMSLGQTQPKNRGYMEMDPNLNTVLAIHQIVSFQHICLYEKVSEC